MKAVRILGASIIVAALAGVAAAAEPESAHGLAAQLRAEGITVTGLGSVRTVPDRAEFVFGVQTSGRTASAAFAANEQAIQRVVAALRNAGVSAAAIQTLQVSLSPRYSDEGEDIQGYTAQNSVGVRVNDLDRAAAIIDAAVNAGANQVYGPSLSRSDQTALYRNALRTAVADARAKAQVIADAAGVTLGGVVGVDETGGDQEAPMAAARDAAPIEPGTREISASVVVSFAVSA